MKLATTMLSSFTYVLQKRTVCLRNLLCFVGFICKYRNFLVLYLGNLENQWITGTGMSFGHTN